LVLAGEPGAARDGPVLWRGARRRSAMPSAAASKNSWMTTEGRMSMFWTAWRCSAYWRGCWLLPLRRAARPAEADRWPMRAARKPAAYRQQLAG
jgi:hypothetical protein